MVKSERNGVPLKRRCQCSHFCVEIAVRGLTNGLTQKQPGMIGSYKSLRVNFRNAQFKSMILYPNYDVASHALAESKITYGRFLSLRQR